jgi:DNA-binding protein Fis
MPAQPLISLSIQQPGGGGDDRTSQSLDEHEKQLLTTALAQAEGNQSKAARHLKIGRDALRYKMKKHGLL